MKKGLLAATFVVYLLTAAAVTILPTQISRLRNPRAEHINLVPFSYSVNCILMAHRIHHDLMGFCLLNTFGNVALFLPLGILLPLLSIRYRSIKRVVLTALCLSVGIESVQFLLRFVGNPRSVDIDDVLLNTLGACLGFVMYRIVNWGMRGRGGTGEQGKRGRWEEVKGSSASVVNPSRFE